MRDVPLPSLLVLVGLAVGLVPGVPTTHLSPEVVTLGVLPPLLFAAAQQISLPELRTVWRPVTVLAVVLVGVTAVAVAAVTHAIEPSIAFAAAFTLGAVLSSTDPVAVTALSRRLRMPDRVATLVQSESLFNDATSLVLFQVAVAAVVTGHTGAAHATALFVRLGGGGVALGAAVGAIAFVLLRRERHGPVILAVDVLTPYAAAIAAHVIDVSPVAAVIVAGLVVAGRRGRQPEAQVRRRIVAGYARAVLMLEDAIFVVIGFELATFLRELPSGQRGTAAVLVVAVTLVLLSVRAVFLAATAAVVGRRQPSRPWQAAAVVTWAGTRGVVPLAAALSIPLTTDAGTAFPDRALLLVVATAAVVISLVVQGTTLRPLVQRLSSGS